MNRNRSLQDKENTYVGDIKSDYKTLQFRSRGMESDKEIN